MSVVESVLDMCEALGWITSPAKKERKKEN
jgi:hypothetical protein